MNVPIATKVNVASYEQVAEHLSACDSTFDPPLSSRVDVQLYTRKLIERAVRHEAWVGSELVGLVATYCTDTHLHMAYVTSVSVLSRWRGVGVAEQLLRASLIHAKTLGLKGARLEVGARNLRALRLYRRVGFRVDQEDDSRVMMCISF